MFTFSDLEVSLRFSDLELMETGNQRFSDLDLMETGNEQLLWWLDLYFRFIFYHSSLKLRFINSIKF